MTHLEEDIVVGCDDKVMGVEEAVLHGELGSCQLLPVAVVFNYINCHVSISHRPQQAACTQIMSRLSLSNTCMVSCLLGVDAMGGICKKGRLFNYLQTS